MDEIETRLKDASENCIKAYEAWNKSKKNPELRESLQEAVHELRKVSARLEIEIAVSEREDLTQRPIPIPPHRSSRRHSGDMPAFISGGSDDDNAGNMSDEQPNFNSDRPASSGRQNRSESGRSDNNRSGGFQRRPMRRQHSGGGSQGGSQNGNQGGGNTAAAPSGGSEE